VFPEELPQNRKLDSTVLKGMSGKDRIKARLLQQNFFTYTPQFTLFFSANPGYEIDATDPAMARRFSLVPFLRSFRDNPDKTLDDKLAAERNGILQWLITGWVGYAQEGLELPAEWREAADEVRADNDAIGSFIEERTQETGARLITNEEIYQAYRAWATEAGEEPASQRRFSAALKQRGYTQRITGGRRCWVGLYPKQTKQGAKNHD
jgi:putative DNA primase/helicase